MLGEDSDTIHSTKPEDEQMRPLITDHCHQLLRHGNRQWAQHVDQAMLLSANFSLACLLVYLCFGSFVGFDDPIHREDIDTREFHEENRGFTQRHK